ncbi:MAG TPA: nickel ABC transporter permease [Symbiobacteriaceae bacterium]|jgi:peptide/nickel transport system permease protein
MVPYIIKRVLHGLMVLLAISLVVFFLLRLTGDPVMALLGQGNPTQEAVAAMQHALGLDQPLWRQLIKFLTDLATGNFGISFRNKQPVMPQLVERMPATMTLAFAGMAVSLLVAVPIGIQSAVRRGKAIDVLGRVFALIGISFPNFWLGIMLMLIFAVKLRWLPASGYQGFKYLILPAVTLGLILSSIITRLIRSAMLDVLRQQYVQTARAKGVAERTVIYRHAFRNALIPTVTFVGLQLGSLLGGTVILEQVFSWPGVGRLALDAISNRDFPMVQGAVLMLSTVMVAINLAVDLTYGFLDPRIKVGGKA